MRKISKVLNVHKSHIRLAKVEELSELELQPGSISPMAISKLSDGYVDVRVLSYDYVLASAGVPYYGIKFDPKVLQYF